MQVNKEVAFARKEIAGSQFLEHVWKAYDEGGHRGRRPHERRRAALQRAATGAGGQFDAPRRGSRLYQGPERRPGAPALEAGQSAMRKVSDGSNLTLDPDIDSFYLIDLVANRLPLLVAAVSDFGQAIQPMSVKGTPTMAEYGLMRSSMTQLDDAVSGGKSAIETAAAATASPSLPPASARWGRSSGRMPTLSIRPARC